MPSKRPVRINKNPKGRPKKPKGKRNNAGGPGGGFLGTLAVAASVAAFLIGSWWRSGQRREQKATTDQQTLGMLLRKKVHYTEHAQCRMGCRFISASEVLDALKTGSINKRKSQPRLQPCPKYVVDAKVSDGRRNKNVQVVATGCSDATNIITVIDKDTNWECYCP